MSGPLLDRFDLRIEVNPPAPAMLLDGPPEEPTASVRRRVTRVRAMAQTRGVESNAALDRQQLDEVAPLSKGAKAVLRSALESGQLTGRGLTRVRSVARTITDLVDPEVELIDGDTIATALSLRTSPSSALGGVR